MYSVPSAVCANLLSGSSCPTYKQLQACGQSVCAVAPPPSLITKGADQLAGTHQTLLSQVVRLLQGCQLGLGV